MAVNLRELLLLDGGKLPPNVWPVRQFQNFDFNLVLHDWAWNVFEVFEVAVVANDVFEHGDLLLGLWIYNVSLKTEVQIAIHR
jgi:hypothetical protein